MKDTDKTNSIRILVVDDDLKIQEILREFLQINGYDVMTCSTGEDALDIMISLKPSLIFLRCEAT